LSAGVSCVFFLLMERQISTIRRKAESLATQ